jgi:hypothetical protein
MVVRASSPVYACLIAPTAPPTVVRAARTIGSSLARRGWTLRTGAAGPGEAAVEQGHREVSHSRLFVQLPWRRFNAHASSYCIVPDQAIEIAKTLIPNPGRAPASQLKLIGAMVQCLLGDTLTRPVDFVVAWTPDGAYVGDAGAALSLVLQRSIPAVNLARLPGTAIVGRTLAAAAEALELPPLADAPAPTAAEPQPTPPPRPVARPARPRIIVDGEAEEVRSLTALPAPARALPRPR